MTKIDRRDFMVTTGLLSAGLATMGISALAGSGSTMAAKLTVEPEPLHDLPRTQYGHFIEHLGACIKGGIWAEGESGDMFLGGIRHELVDAMKSINPALIRYPGGCFADGYHWQDGIGPRASRPRRKNRAWAKLGKKIGPPEDNHFGTDEFLQLCKTVGAEPQITVNVGSGTAEEAAAWVEYCNGPSDSGWGRWRAKNGHEEPYNVKYWYIGNEIFGMYEIGHQNPAVYVNTVKEYAQAMRKVDPDIKLIACGNLFPGKMGKNINRTVLAGAGQYFDYLSIHHYVPLPMNVKNILQYQVAHRKGSKSPAIYYDVIASYKTMENFLERNLTDIRSYSPAGKEVPLCFDEWNLWFYFLSDIYYANFNLRDGLWVATMLNMLHRHAPEVPLANIAQMVNCLGIITSTEKGTFLTPSALVYRMYTENAGESLLPSRVECPPIPHETELPALDVSATRTAEKLALFLVNRHYEAEIILDCALNGMAASSRVKRVEMYHPNPVEYNTFENPCAVKINERDENLSVDREGNTGSFKLRLLPHSLSCVVLDVTAV